MRECSSRSTSLNTRWRCRSGHQHFVQSYKARCVDVGEHHVNSSPRHGSHHLLSFTRRREGCGLCQPFELGLAGSCVVTDRMVLQTYALDLARSGTAVHAGKCFSPFSVANNYHHSTQNMRQRTDTVSDSDTAVAQAHGRCCVLNRPTWARHAHSQLGM